MLGQADNEEVALDSDSEVLPFPMRNPLVNIKDAKKQAQEDMKADTGFGHITNQLKGNTS